MNASARAERLCILAEKQGLCHPTQEMIAEAIYSALCDQLFEVDYDLRKFGHDAAADCLEKLHALKSVGEEP